MEGDKPKRKGSSKQSEHLARVRQPKRKGMIRAETRAKLNASKKGIAMAVKSGVSPLEVMIKRMRDPDSVSKESFDAACAAAPYVHPKLNAVAYKDMTDKGDAIDLTGLSAEQLAVLRMAVRTGAPPKNIPGPVLDAVLEDEQDAIPRLDEGTPQ